MDLQFKPLSLNDADPSKNPGGPSPGNQRIVVAMSGGVDSSVAAVMLHEAGYEVVGITLKLIADHSEVKRSGCCSGRDAQDARRVADQFGFAHYTLDFQVRFRQAVLNPFVTAYQNGETPIPCTACNQLVKFGDLMQTARDLNAAALATGHYACIETRNDQPALVTPVDANRDQSYFLFNLSTDQLANIWFPLGNLTKAQVREKAHKYKLKIADKPDSQDICFVHSDRYTSIIRSLSNIPPRSGPIRHVSGQQLGRHTGIEGFTVGQRRGLGLAWPEALFVIAVEPESGTVVVGERKYLGQHQVPLRQVNWIGDGTLEDACASKLRMFVKVRSSHTAVPGHIRRRPDTQSTRTPPVEVVLDDRTNAVAPGQACVFYDSPHAGARVLGGGWITRPDQPVIHVNKRQTVEGNVECKHSLA